MSTSFPLEPGDMLLCVAQGIKSAVAVKVAYQLNLKQEDCPMSSRWVQCDHKGPETWKRQDDKATVISSERDLTQPCWH